MDMIGSMDLVLYPRLQINLSISSLWWIILPVCLDYGIRGRQWFCRFQACGWHRVDFQVVGSAYSDNADFMTIRGVWQLPAPETHQSLVGSSSIYNWS